MDKKIDDKSIPLLIWLNGGPGSSSMFGAYEELGPYEIKKIDDELKAVKRKISWNEKYHLLFIDSPVRVGYSVGFGDYKVTTTE